MAWTRSRERGPLVGTNCIVTKHGTFAFQQQNICRQNYQSTERSKNKKLLELYLQHQRQQVHWKHNKEKNVCSTECWTSIGRRPEKTLTTRDHDHTWIMKHNFKDNVHRPQSKKAHSHLHSDIQDSPQFTNIRKATGRRKDGRRSPPKFEDKKRRSIRGRHIASEKKKTYNWCNLETFLERILYPVLILVSPPTTAKSFPAMATVVLQKWGSKSVIRTSVWVRLFFSRLEGSYETYPALKSYGLHPLCWPIVPWGPSVRGLLEWIKKSKEIMSP